MRERKKERLVAFNRANILESAHELFLKKGIAGTTMDDIAKEAGYSKTTIYNYFESKEDLVNHLFLEGMDSLLEKAREGIEKTASIKEFYTSFCSSMTAMYDEQPIYYQGISGTVDFDENALPENVLNKIYQSGEALNSAIEARIAKAITEKEITDVNGSLTAETMFLWFCSMGIIEKSSLKEKYIAQKLGMTRNEFMDYAFQKLFTLFERT